MTSLPSPDLTLASVSIIALTVLLHWVKNWAVATIAAECYSGTLVQWCHHLVDNVDLDQRAITGAAGAPARRVSAITGNHTGSLRNNIKLYLVHIQDYINIYGTDGVITLNCGDKLQTNRHKNTNSLMLTTNFLELYERLKDWLNCRWNVAEDKRQWSVGALLPNRLPGLIAVPHERRRREGHTFHPSGEQRHSHMPGRAWGDLISPSSFVTGLGGLLPSTSFPIQIQANTALQSYPSFEVTCGPAHSN